ncbi:MAG: type IX secretion system protein PorQ [Flavobacteriales bacterium]|nr:type IX secretion system protein PorQ [Flavobacteriales bacterium]
MKRTFCFLFFLFFTTKIFPQIGGENTFAILDFSTSARSTAMGGDLIAIFDNDVNLAASNPALLNAKMNRQISFSFVDYFSDINAVSVNYATNSKKIGMLFFGAKALNYGSFTKTDEVGLELGEFTANEQVLTAGISKLLNENFTVGMSINFINSKLEQYSSFALASNFGLTYCNNKKDLCVSVLAKDFGRQLKSFTNTNEKLPFQLQMGVSKGLAHLPFRFSIVAHHLNKFDISNNYLEPTITDPISGEKVENEESFGKKVLRHFIIGGELNPFKKSLFIRGGFNFQRRQDMQLPTRPVMVGFSWGLGFKISKFHLNYSRATYHLAGASNIFSFTTNLSSLGL